MNALNLLARVLLVLLVGVSDGGVAEGEWLAEGVVWVVISDRCSPITLGVLLG